MSAANERLVEEIAERQKLERALRISEQNYRSIVEDQTEMILRFTHDGTITFANRAYCDRYQMTPEEAKGKSCFDGIHPEYRQAAMATIAATSQNKPTGAILLKVLRPDGTKDWAEWTGRALYDVDGCHLGFQAIGRIVTDLVEAQEKLKESELRYRSIVEDQSELIVRFDRTGSIEFANAAFMRANRLTAESIRSANVFDFISPGDRPLVAAKLQSVSPDSPYESIRTCIAREDGQYWEDWYGRALYNEQHEFICYQAVGRDVTELVRAEKELHEKEELLRHASRLSTLGEMVAAITHELRQPLSSIANFAFACEKALEGGSLAKSERLKQWNREIIDQVTRADDIVRRLRGFARRAEAEPTRLSINAIAQEAVAMLKFDLQRARVRVVEALSGEVPEMMLDRLQIQQVLVNLIRNACDAFDAHSQSEPTIWLRSRRDGDEILFSVCDNGPGLDEASLERVFQPFNSSKSDGLGLGLAICRSIVEEHEGRIWAQNNHPGLAVHLSLSLAPQSNRDDGPDSNS